MLNKRMPLLTLVLVLAAVTVPAEATKPPKLPNPPAGQGMYMVVLWEPGTPVPDAPAERIERVPEPDIEKAGGRLLEKKNNTRVVFLPPQAAKQLQKHQAVAYVQRIWMGEALDDLDETSQVSTILRVRNDSDPDLSWGPKTITYDRSGNIKQFGGDSYAYDSVGRLISSTVSGKTETYAYDTFGNLTAKTTNGNTVTIPVDPGSNHILGAEYDANGNQTTSGHRVYTYDALNMITSTKVAGTRRILYDANDERIGTLIDSTLSRWTLRDFEGQVVREYKGESYGMGMLWTWELDHFRGDGILLGGESQSWAYNGQSSGTHKGGGLRHHHLDHLGSVRMVTNAAGRSLSQNDFYPFGTTITKMFQEPINWGDPHVDMMRFAGHWRDNLGYVGAESNDYLDYMHARYYDPGVGRFLSVDPVEGGLAGPQSWNKYVYTENDPVGSVDPTGEFSWSITVRATQPKSVTAESWFNVTSEISSDFLKTVTFWNYAAGSASYFRGLQRYETYKMKFVAGADRETQGRVIAEAYVAAELAKRVPALGALLAEHKGDIARALAACGLEPGCRTVLLTVVTQLADQIGTNENAQRFAGRLVTSVIVSRLIKRAGGGKAGGLFGLAAGMGDAMWKIEQGHRSFEAMLEAILVGK